jgi:2-alkyl-3-oxoalkanoate reductase
MKVLVTGATSLIGAHVVARLCARGDEVTAFQRGHTERAGGFPAAPETTHAVTVLGDVADPDAVAAAVEGHDAVVHLAAKVGVTGTFDEYVRANVTGTRTLLAAARAAGVTRFVHVSSPSVAHGGEALVGAAAEPADPGTTRGHYATTKAEAERIALGATADGFAVTAIRPHLVWGPGDTQLVGRIVDRARSGRLALVGSGTALIDTTYIDNAADALVAALDRASEITGEALVVSNGEPLTVREILDRITIAAGVGPPRLAVPRRLAFAVGLVAEKVWDRTGRLDDPPMTSFLAEQLSTAHWFDQRHTREALGWEPAISLDEGFDRLAAWYRSTDAASPGMDRGPGPTGG